MYNANRVLHRLCFFLHIYVVKVHCNLGLLDNVDDIGHRNVGIEWYLDEDSDWRNMIFELSRTFTNFIISWTLFNFVEL